MSAVPVGADIRASVPDSVVADPPGMPVGRLPRRGRLRAATVLGPAFVAAVAYVDPGNIATNTAAGSQLGFGLLWVVVLASLMAGVVQYLAAKVGLVTGRPLPQLVAERTGRRARIAYWAQAELVAVATDVAETVGAAVGLYLLFGVPLVAGGLVAGTLGMVLLWLRDRGGARAFELTCGASLAVVGAGFVVGLVAAPPHVGELAAGLIPHLANGQAVLLAAGIVGATVMPHAVYLHSALTTEAHPCVRVNEGSVPPRPGRNEEALANVRVEGGSVPPGRGRNDEAHACVRPNEDSVPPGRGRKGSVDGSLEQTTATLGARVGQGAATAFAVALLVSGLTSTAVGTHAGSVIMGGLLRRRIPVVARRLLTLVPSLALLAFAGQPMEVLILSQVGLALGLPFALVPLLRISADRPLMGAGRNRAGTTAVAAVIIAIVVVLDLALVVLTLRG